MEETADDLNEELNISVLSQASSSEDRQSTSNTTSKHKKIVENCVPWRYCLSQLQRCKDEKNKAQFKKLIDAYSKAHTQQRKKDALAKGRLIWTDFEERYGSGEGDIWLDVEADLISREDLYYSFVNILVKADPSSGVPCRALKRVNGECRGHPEHSVKVVKDPRTRLKRTPRTVPLLVPKYPLDDYTAFAPPRREIAFIELNDNVHHDYLYEFCCAKGKRELVYLQIYTDPTNGNHLGMGLAEFKTTQQAMDFYEQCGSNPRIMGFSSKIFVDTLGFWITDEFTRLTGQEPPSMPPRRALFKEDDQILRIRELIRIQNLRDGVRDNQQNTPSDTFQNDIETTKPAGARTPVEEMPNSSSASINSLSRSNSHESMEQIEEINEPRQRNGRSPVNSEHSPLANGHAKRRRSHSPSRSRHSRDFRHHNGHSHSSSRRRDDFDSHSYRDRKRRLNARDDKYSSKYRRRDFSISPDRTKSSYRSSRKRSVSSSSTRSGSSDSYRKPKRSYSNRDRSNSKTRRSDSRSEKLSEVSQPPDPINLCVQPPLQPFDLPLPFSAAYPPPFFPHFFPAPPIAEPNSIDSIPTIAEDAPVRLKPVQRELGPYFVMNKTDRVEFFKQMRMAGYYNEYGTFVIPTLRLYEENVCSFLVTEFFVELEHLQEPAPVNPQITKLEQIKEQLKSDLLLSLKASMCQKIETLLYTEVDRLHAEYEVKQKLLDEERSKMKRPETKQIFDFEEQFSNTSSMGTRSMFGSNRMLQFNRNIFATKKIPKKDGEIVAKKLEKSSHRRKSVEMKSMKKEIKKKLKMESPSIYKSPSPAVRSTSRASTISSIKKSPRTPSAQSTASTLSRSSSVSSVKSTSGEASDHEPTRQKRIISSESSSTSVSQPTSPKAVNAEMNDLQITQSRTMPKVDYCEDNSSESEGGLSDWAENFGIDEKQKKSKKSSKKQHNQRPKDDSSDSDESLKTKERPKKPKQSKPIVIKEESPEPIGVDLQSQIEERSVPVKREIPPPKTPPEISEPASPIVIPATIKIEPQVEVKKEPEVLLVEKLPVEEPPAVVKPPKPRVPKPKPIDLPQGHVQRFPNARFPVRVGEEARRILFDYADEEDAQFIMLAARNKEISITQLSENEQIRRPIIFSNPFATPDPLPVLPSPKPSKSGNQRRNSTYLEAAQRILGSREGAARLITYKRGDSKLTDGKPSSINYGFIEVTKKDEQAARNKQEKRRELRALQRNLVSTVGDCSIVRQNVFKFREKMLKFARSGIHGWGLFTLEDIQPNDMIIEYVGELIRPAVADVRECSYTRRGIGSSYLFRMDDDSVIDATGKGNVARFINHSCNPNCFARVIGKAEQKAICIYAKRFIARGEEVTYDYQFPIEEVKIPCHCGSPMCRLYLN